MTSLPDSRVPSQRLFRLVIGLGAVFSILMLARSQVAGDQLNMLARGWLLVAEGQWIPFGLPTSAGGKAPGGLTALVTGLPLLAWKHHRAPSLLLLALQVVAYVLLDRLVSRIAGQGGRLLFAILYWLSPWRLYHSTFLWNPSYMLFFGALHLWSTHRQRHRESSCPASCWYSRSAYQLSCTPRPSCCCRFPSCCCGGGTSGSTGWVPR
jgi:hypothetical protein